MNKIRAELIKEGIWADSSAAPSYDELKKCAYLEAVVNETLRLYPPASPLSRQAKDPYEVCGGFRVGGATIFVSPYIMARHPLLWKDPEVFRPERFLDGSEHDISSKFIPFSRGPRDCIGKYFAMLEAKLAISALVMQYNFKCVDPSDRPIAVVTTLPEKGAQVKFTRREDGQES